MGSALKLYLAGENTQVGHKVYFKSRAGERLPFANAVGIKVCLGFSLVCLPNFKCMQRFTFLSFLSSLFTELCSFLGGDANTLETGAYLCDCGSCTLRVVASSQISGI